MLRKFSFKNIFIPILISILSITLLSCSEDDSIEPQKDHFEAEGIVFQINGETIATIWRGETTDTLYVENGQQSEQIQVQFLGESKEIIGIPDIDHHSFSAQIENGNIADLILNSAGFEIYLVGKTVGITTGIFYIDHDGHHDFTSGNIPIVVK